MKKLVLGAVLAGTLLFALVPPANAQYYGRRSYYRPPYRGYVYQHRYYVPRPYYRPYRWYPRSYHYPRHYPSYYPGYYSSYSPGYYYPPAPYYYEPGWGVSVWW